MGQFNFQPFHNVSGNLHEKITLGDSIHTEVLRYGETMSDIQQMYGLYQNAPITRDGTLPAAGQYATYDASRVLGGSQPLQFFSDGRERLIRFTCILTTDDIKEYDTRPPVSTLPL